MSKDVDLINELLAHNNELEWLEFKRGNSGPEIIGKLCSALSNSARINQLDKGYCIWGIDDATKSIVGTHFTPNEQRISNQPLSIWLSTSLANVPEHDFKIINHPYGRVVLLTVSAAIQVPATFKGDAYCRIGESLTSLSPHPQKHRCLISALAATSWEEGTAKDYVSGNEVLFLLDYSQYFKLLNQPVPQNIDGILSKLEADNIVIKDTGNKWKITNLGAILFATDLQEFGSSIQRKAVRLTIYNGKNKSSTVIKRVDGQKGYAVGFENMIATLNRFTPENEYIGNTRRESVPLFPAIAVRELIANALIHQDFTLTGAGPMIDLFDNRIEISNPGKSLIETNRMIDLPPRSRNEKLASLMRRLGFCEESGTGLDKVIAAVEQSQSPAPDFRNSDAAMQVILQGPMTYAQMTAAERVRACYQHAVIKFLSGEMMKNKTLRTRLGIDDKNSALASAVIKNALDEGLIKSADPAHPRSGYVPFWG